jgi:hypothetical protein
LRAGEACSLCIDDIDSSRMVLRRVQDEAVAADLEPAS